MATTTTSSSPPPAQQQPIAPASAQQTSGMSRWVPSLSLPTINLNTLNPFGNGEEEKKQSSPEQQKTPSTKNRTLLSTFALGGSATNNASASRDSSPARSDAGTTMFAEPDRSEDGDSHDGSINEGRRSSKLRSNKPKTCYSVCHPPTTSLTKQKLHLRPRSLLQLHRLQPNARPMPAFEVVPSANFSVRLNKDLTRIYRGRHAVCPNDFVVLRAEKYGTAEEDPQEVRDIIGLICNRQKLSKDDANPPTAGQAKVKICINSSAAEWEACCLPSGGYEFFTTDSHGLGQRVRWVPKKDKDGSKATNKDGSQRFNFSSIDPNSRRHPVIGALSRKGLDVYDSYRLPDPNVTPQPTPKRNSNSALADAMEEEGAAGSADQKETSDALREIITMTAIWVTFKEGWSPTFKYSSSADEDKAGLRSASAMGMNASPSKSALSLTTPPGSPPQPTTGLEKRNSVKSIGSDILRRTSLLGGRAQGNRASQASVPEEELRAAGIERSDSVGKRTGRARGDSTSTVLVHRAASNRRKHNAQAAGGWRPDVLASTDEERRGFTHPPAPAKAPAEQRKEAWECEGATAGEAGDGVAKPLIPSMTEGSETAGEDVADSAHPMSTQQKSPTQQQRTLRPRTPSGTDKRVSDATTVTVGSGAVGKGGKAGRGRKRGGWRRLLCGGNPNDI